MTDGYKIILFACGSLGMLAIPFWVMIYGSLAEDHDCKKRKLWILDANNRMEAKFGALREAILAINWSLCPHVNLSESEIKRIHILFSLAYMGTEGLNMDSIMWAWKWDGSELGRTKFSADWSDLRPAFPNDGPHQQNWLVSGPERPYGTHHEISKSSYERYYLSESGRDYLLNLKII